MYTANTTLYHHKLGSNPERITKKLATYTETFNWHEIDFPPSYNDYAIFEQLNGNIALHIFYVPPGEKNICP